MSTYLLSPAARTDLDEIWDYTAQRWSVDQAERYIREITDGCQAVAEKRREGRSATAIRAGYFKLSVGSHFVFYRFNTDGVVDVIRILHKSMDLAAQLTQ